MSQSEDLNRASTGRNSKDCWIARREMKIEYGRICFLGLDDRSAIN